MRETNALLVGLFINVIWWMADRLWGDVVFMWIRPIVPDSLSDPKLENIVTFGPILIVSMIILIIFTHNIVGKIKKMAENNDKLNGRTPSGISITDCRDVKIVNSKGGGLSTFIRAQNSSGLDIHRNKTNNTGTFMELDGVRDVRATGNQHNGLPCEADEKPVNVEGEPTPGQTRKLRGWVRGWRPPKG